MAKQDEQKTTTAAAEKEAREVYAEFMRTGKVRPGWEVSPAFPGGARKKE